MGYNSAFKGLIYLCLIKFESWINSLCLLTADVITRCVARPSLVSLQIYVFAADMQLELFDAVMSTDFIP